MPDRIIYPADHDQVAAVDAKLDVIDGKVTPMSLDNVTTMILDFVYDDVTIMSGGLESLSRRITT